MRMCFVFDCVTLEREKKNSPAANRNPYLLLPSCFILSAMAVTIVGSSNKSSKRRPCFPIRERLGPHSLFASCVIPVTSVGATWPSNFERDASSAQPSFYSFFFLFFKEILVKWRLYSTQRGCCLTIRRRIS